MISIITKQRYFFNYAIIAYVFFANLTFSVSAEEGSVEEKDRDCSNKTRLFPPKNMGELIFNSTHSAQRAQIITNIKNKKLEVLRCWGDIVEKNATKPSIVKKGSESIEQLLSLSHFKLAFITSMDQTVTEELDEQMSIVQKMMNECNNVKMMIEKNKIVDKEKSTSLSESLKIINISKIYPKAYALISSHINKELLCGKAVNQSIKFGIGIGLSKNKKTRICITPFGKQYNIVTPSLALTFAFGGGITKDVRKNDDYYSIVKKYNMKIVPIIQSMDENYCVVDEGKVERLNNGKLEYINVNGVGANYSAELRCGLRMKIKQKSMEDVNSNIKIIDSIVRKFR
ncbi:MAG: hypothetical protein HQK49_16885 [Oligoflexia bacterium]|nr:hypothetical protein [Oligoflexia bacterium]